MEGATRRYALAMIGATAGSAALYSAMKAIHHVQPSSYKGPIKLDGDPKGAKVLVLGAGLAGTDDEQVDGDRRHELSAARIRRADFVASAWTDWLRTFWLLTGLKVAKWPNYHSN